MALNTAVARAELFGGLFTTDSDNVGGRDRVQVWVWVAPIRVRWEGKVGITGSRGREGDTS